MASAALKEPENQPDPPETGQDEGQTQQEAPRDLEAEARQHGWVPKEEFKGDESRWVDHETFMKRADEMMPLLKKDRDRFKRELDEVKRQARKLVDHFSKAEERIRAELVAEMEEAVENSDVEAFRAAKKKADNLDKEAVGKSAHTAEDAAEAFDEWCDANPWYDRGNLAGATEAEKDARAYADRLTQRHIEKTKDMAPAEFFAFIGSKVEEKYGDKLKAKPARQKPPSDVSGATNGRGARGGKTFADLPPDAQRLADKWVKQGLLKSREDYVKTYDWS